MYKCLDMDKIHFIEGDTDSMYWAIAGDPNDGFKQGFKHVVKDKEYDDNHVFKFLPYNFFCFDEKSRPVLNTQAEKLAHEKKLLGLAVEKEGLNMVALSPKCYVSWDNKVTALKCKGINTKQNKQLTKDSYMDILDNGGICTGQNVNLQFKNGGMKQITISKTALSGKLTKSVVRENGSCFPLVLGCNY